jgi:hypothetical protein
MWAGFSRSAFAASGSRKPGRIPQIRDAGHLGETLTFLGSKENREGIMLASRAILTMFAAASCMLAIQLDHAAAQGDVMEGSASGSSRSYATTIATSLAKDQCYVRGFRNIANVKIECTTNMSVMGNKEYECTALVACNE